MTQRDKLLHLFRDSQWHNNYELVRIMINYRTRLSEFRKKGFVFDRKHIGNTTEWQWKLISEPENKSEYKFEESGQGVFA